MAFNTPEEGIRVVKSRFNGFQELENRKDAAQKLLAYYEQVDVAAIAKDVLRGTRGNMTLPRLTYVEHILQSMTSLFSKDEMHQLNALASAKESVKLSYPEIFSENSKNVLFKQERTRAGDSIVSMTYVPLYYGYSMEGINLSPDYNWAERVSIAADVLLAHPLVTILSPATVTYNCHSYAWNMTEYQDSQGDPLYTTWINYLKSDYSANVSLNWTVGPFEMASSFSNNTPKIFYSQGDHSAVKSSVSGKFESKWGMLPLIRHSPSDCPYDDTNLIYFKYFNSYRPLLCSGPDMELQLGQPYVFYTTDVSNETFLSRTWYVYENKNGDDVTGIWATVSNPSYTSSEYSAYITFSHAGLYTVKLEILRASYHSVTYEIEVYVEPSV